MTVWQALILGLVQGLTEFLPISSSGHLVLFQQWFGLQASILSFDIVIHLGTLLAIIFFFGKSLFKVTRREWMMVGIGTVPAVIVGLLFKKQIEALFISDALVGIELMITGLINLYTDRKLAKTPVDAPSKQLPLTPKKSFLIGVAQAIAIIPGISRSGSTVAGAIGLGLDREQAFRFSFLLAIPALIGAAILQTKDVLEVGVGDISLLAFFVGAVAALVTGIASLALFKYVMTKARLEWFGWYCLIVGGVATLAIL